MQRRFLPFAVQIAVACVFTSLIGCATIITGTSAPVSINSNPESANVEIKRADGIVVEQGQTPMTVKLGKGRDYTVTINLDGYQTRTVGIQKGGVQKAAFLNLFGLLGWAIDYATKAMFKLEPSTINVSLQKVTSQNGGDTAIYAVVTWVSDDGMQKYVTTEMEPVVNNRP